MGLKPWVILSFQIVALALAVNAQRAPPPNSWPHTYPGMPSGDYSPEWQAYFQVTDSLPNVSWPLPRNWAGNIPVRRDGHPNDTLFFWAFESSNGSFTECDDKPWGIWLNGGPGYSSLNGLLFENGPINIAGNYSLFNNPYTWTALADMVWIDQPVGTGFSTAESEGYIYNEDQMATDFMGFLKNFVDVFPNLARRPLYLIGESYAGKYIPYILKAYFGMDNPPVNIARIAIGDGAIGPLVIYMELPVVSVIETYPQIIGYDPEVLEYFREQSSLCGYNITLQYPQSEPFPTLTYVRERSSAGSSDSAKYGSKFSMRELVLELHNRVSAKFAKRDSAISKRERVHTRESWKRNLADRANGTIDPWYGCDLYDEMIDYATNFTFPWTLSQSGGATFDIYDVPAAYFDGQPLNASFFLDDPQTRTAIHAPTSKKWGLGWSHYPFGDGYSKDPSPFPMAFLSDLATNATAHNVTIVIFSANDDSVIAHLSSQVAIQNTTFGGIRGFTRKPETPWYNDDGEFAGIVHQERGWTYVLAVNAGHILGYTNPVTAFTLTREFILGNNQTGLVTNTSSGSVVGGEVPALGNEIIPGQAGIYYGTASGEHTYYFPTATVEAWSKYMATATPYYST